MSSDYLNCISVISERPEVFRGPHFWGKTLNRLRALGFIEGDNSSPVLTGKKAIERPGPQARKTIARLVRKRGL